MFGLLSSCALFWPLPNGALLQLSGPLPATGSPSPIDSRTPPRAAPALAVPTQKEGGGGTSSCQPLSGSRSRAVHKAPIQRLTAATRRDVDPMASGTVIDMADIGSAQRPPPPSELRCRSRSWRTTAHATSCASQHEPLFVVGAPRPPRTTTTLNAASVDVSSRKWHLPLRTRAELSEPGDCALQLREESDVTAPCSDNIRLARRRELYMALAGAPQQGDCSTNKVVRAPESECNRCHGELLLLSSRTRLQSDRRKRRKQPRATTSAEVGAELEYVRLKRAAVAESEALRVLLREIIAEMPEPCRSVPLVASEHCVLPEGERKSGRVCSGGGSDGVTAGVAALDHRHRRAGRRRGGAGARKAPHLHGTSGQRLLRQLLRRRAVMSCHALVRAHFQLEPSVPSPMPRVAVAENANAPWGAQLHYQARVACVCA